MNIEKCPITKLHLEEVYSPNHRDAYKIKINDEYLFICLPYFENWIQKPIFKENIYLFAGAILNKQLADENESVYWFTLTEDTIETKLKQIIYPKTPKAKIDNLLKAISDFQNFDGEGINIIEKIQKYQQIFHLKLFFKTHEECFSFFKFLNYLELINCSFQANTNLPVKCNITYKGLNYLLDLSENGNLSKKCFVAMSFDQEMKKTRDIIKEVILNNEYEPILIDEIQIDSSQTINDAIIAYIKSCKFCIADFSQQKYGVYFESGFAVGLGKPVIYTCHKNYFKDTHFDTNHFPHIIYENDEELKQKLNLKIKAWIK